MAKNTNTSAASAAAPLVTPPGNGSNSQPDRTSALKEAYEMGKREGNGSAARAGFYLNLVAYAKEKRLDVTDSEDSWDNFDKGAAAGAAMVGGMKASDNPTDTRKVRISEVRQFLKMGGIPYIDPVAVMDRAVAIIKKARLEGRVKSKPTDCMINVARAQNNDEQNELDDQTIEIVIQPKVGHEKVEADALASVINDLEKVTKKFGESDEVTDAIAYIDKRIQDLGGTTKQKRSAAALAKKAAASANQQV
jgi:hypothetical protein